MEVNRFRPVIGENIIEIPHHLPALTHWTTDEIAILLFIRESLCSKNCISA